jgi:hypothetical protein
MAQIIVRVNVVVTNGPQFAFNQTLTDESVPAFQTDVAQADVVRASALAGLQQLYTARRNYAIREQIQLAAKLGEDHPDVVRLKAEVEADQHFGSVLSSEIDRVNATAPVVNERGWALHGFVRDQELQGQPKLTIALFDRSNRWIESLGYTCTDDRGYFQLCFVPGKEIRLEQGRELFVHISNPKQQELYRDKKPMLAALGETKYREIIIGEEATVCSPPSSPQKPGASTASSAKPAKKTRTAKKTPKSKKA